LTIGIILALIGQLNPFKLLNLIDIDESAAGSVIHSLGLLGLRSDTVGEKGAALVGFTGIRIIQEWKLEETDKSFYLGSSLFITEGVLPA
jgi:hypothetical protein